MSLTPNLTDEGYRCPKCGAFCEIKLGELLPHSGRRELVVCKNCGAGIGEKNNESDNSNN